MIPIKIKIKSHINIMNKKIISQIFLSEAVNIKGKRILISKAKVKFTDTRVKIQRKITIKDHTTPP